MDKDETIQIFFNRVTKIASGIKIFGDTLEDKKLYKRLLRSLLPKFDPIVAIIEEYKDLSTLTIKELMGSIQAHEERLHRLTNWPLNQAF